LNGYGNAVIVTVCAGRIYRDKLLLKALGKLRITVNLAQVCSYGYSMDF